MTGMRMFFSVFFGSFCAIMAAAAALYFIKDYQDTEAAKQVLQQTTSAAKRMSTYGSPPAATLAETAPNDGSIELRNELTLAKAVSIKTADGDMTIPAGTVVHTVHEKATPGTVHINYEGYTVAVPFNAIAPLESH